MLNKIDEVLRLLAQTQIKRFHESGETIEKFLERPIEKHVTEVHRALTELRRNFASA